MKPIFVKINTKEICSKKYTHYIPGEHFYIVMKGKTPLYSVKDLNLVKKQDRNKKIKTIVVEVREVDCDYKFFEDFEKKEDNEE